MKIYAENNDFRVALLAAEDWRVYRALRIGYFKDENDSYLLERQEKKMPADWRREVTERIIFALLHGDMPVGHLKMFDPPARYKKLPELQWIHILNAYRHRHLPDLLYSAVFKYLAAETTHRKCFGRVYETARESFAAAIRNGMVHVRTQHPQTVNDDPGDYYIVEKDLRSLRQNPEP